MRPNSLATMQQLLVKSQGEIHSNQTQNNKKRSPNTYTDTLSLQSTMHQQQRSQHQFTCAHTFRRLFSMLAGPHHIYVARLAICVCTRLWNPASLSRSLLWWILRVRREPAAQFSSRCSPSLFSHSLISVPTRRHRLRRSRSTSCALPSRSFTLNSPRHVKRHIINNHAGKKSKRPVSQLFATAWNRHNSSGQSASRHWRARRTRDLDHNSSA